MAHVNNGEGVFNTMEVGGGFGDTGVTISAAGVIQADGAFTASGAITGGSLVVGGGYGSTGLSVSAAGVLQANGAMTTDGAITAASAVVGGGYGSTGCTVSAAGVVSANGAGNFDGGVTAGVDGTAGTLTVFPGTTTTGTLTVTTADNAGDTVTNINVAAQAGARTLTVPDPGASATFLMSSGNAAVVPTADGATTGIVPDTATFISIASTNDDHIVTLPTAVVGRILRGMIDVDFDCELRCPQAGEKINDVDCGATNEAALPKDSSFILECVSATEWILTVTTKLGAVLTAIVPDARA